jgi:glyoxylase-like metal-dependent hydrolase (beta-lactamase superfamily II)
VAILDVLMDGYARDEGEDSRVGSTASLIRDGEVTVVVDPGLAPSRSAILDPMAALGVRAEDVTDVVISHHHPDHTVNVALFPNARLHDHWAWYRDDLWVSREAEGFALSPDVTLLETPGTRRRTSAPWSAPTTGSSSARTCGGWPMVRPRIPTRPTRGSSTSTERVCSPCSPH